MLVRMTTADATRSPKQPRPRPSVGARTARFDSLASASRLRGTSTESSTRSRNTDNSLRRTCSTMATAYDLRTGAKRWRATVPGVTRSQVTQLDQETAVISAISGAGPFHVVDLRSGALLWSGTGIPTSVRLEGASRLLVTSGAKVSVHEPRSQTPITPPTKVPSTKYVTRAGGADYQFPDPSVTAVRLPDLGVQWKVPILGDDLRITAIPNGFLTDSLDGHELVAYLG